MIEDRRWRPGFSKSPTGKPLWFVFRVIDADTGEMLRDGQGTIRKFRSYALALAVAERRNQREAADHQADKWLEWWKIYESKTYAP